MRWSTVIVPALSALALVLVACDDGTPTPTTEPSDFTEYCQDYVQGIAEATEAGDYTVSILDANPAPPDRGKNDLVVKVVDGQGNAVDSGITLVVEPWMPAHGHGSTNVTATARGADGEYDAPQVNLIRPGAWEFRMLITPDGEPNTEHKAVFTFCAEG